MSEVLLQSYCSHGCEPTSETFVDMKQKIIPSLSALSADVLEEFEKESVTYSRI